MLAQWIAPEYLNLEQLEKINERFAEQSYAVLNGFLRADVASQLTDALAAVDSADSFGKDGKEPPIPPYEAGVTDGWELIGPPHLRRFLRCGTSAASGSSSSKPTPKTDKSDSPHGKLGAGLSDLCAGLVSTPAFRRWLNACTGLAPRDAGYVEARRFRPGLDYTVAARATAPATDRAELDATLVFVQDGDAERVKIWEEEEVGGFESYIAEDDDETAEAQEIYKRDADDGPLVNLPAKSNTLCLVMRDSQTLRFVKYLSRDAPSSRVDVAACFGVDAPDGPSDSDSA